ncbi:MAG TPA: hypothetical protein PL196_06625, partial [Burkholderiaceae bacterium]|nr:hypothetical protein [Burkholderiaceae bacterium]
DNFDGATQIAPTRWIGMERTRKVEAGAMRVTQRDLGSQSANSGASNSSWDSGLSNPTAITQMRAVITVDDFDVTACGANPAPSTIEARLVGLFFNAGPGVPTSLVNDVGAKIRIVRASNSADGVGVLRAEGQVFQCTVGDCNTNDVVLGTADLGTVTLGEAVTLRMEWDPGANRFNFFRGSNPVVRVNYAVGDALPPYYPLRAVGTRTSLANCFSGDRTEGHIAAKIDKVSVNASAVP